MTFFEKPWEKKQAATLAKMKSKFIIEAHANGHKEDVLQKIWKDWESFAMYAFNKSHSTCYAWIAYQTAYLKAHYPAEYMASVLSDNMSDIKSVSFFMEECKRMGLEVLGPDINESYLKFSVNKEGAVRFGMGAIKGVGGSAVKAIIKERKENGSFKSIFDVTKRVDLRSANKKAFDGLILAGGLTLFPTHIERSILPWMKKVNPLSKRRFDLGTDTKRISIRRKFLYLAKLQKYNFQNLIYHLQRRGTMEQLAKEKREVVGMYISAHPLDDFKNR